MGRYVMMWMIGVKPAAAAAAAHSSLIGSVSLELILVD